MKQQRRGKPKKRSTRYVEKQGVLKTIIKNAYDVHNIDIYEEALTELGRGGKRG